MIFQAQIHNFRKTVAGDNILCLSVDKSFNKDIVGVMDMDAGTPVMVRVEVIEDNEPSKNTDTKEKFRKMMHVKIREVADKTGAVEGVIKDSLKIILIQKGLIKESTTELDIKGYAIACNILDEM